MLKKEILEVLLDHITKMIIEQSQDFTDFDIEHYKRIMTGDGQIITHEPPNLSTEIVLYQEDYQQSLTEVSFDTMLHTVADCQWNGNDYTEFGDLDSEVFYTNPATGSNYDAMLNPDELPFITFNLTGCTPAPYTNYLNITEDVLQLLSHFLQFSDENYVIDVEKAKQILDTTIFELIPRQITRQERINKFFAEYEALKGEIPPFNLDVDSDDIPDTWASDISTNQDIHHNVNDIKPNEPNVGNIVRLDKHAEDTLNEGQTLQALRDDVTEFLSDIDKPIIVSVEDERPEYESQSKGYLRINGLNQGIIIKNEEGKVMNFIGDDEFNPRWLTEGFTIGLWVKFLNKSTDGTLFQLGNPFSGYDETGDYQLPCDPGECEPGIIKPSFALQTFTLNKNEQVKPDSNTWGTWEEYVTNTLPAGGTTFTSAQDFFTEADDERFIRLVVRDQYGSFWDSHVGRSKGRNGWISARYNNWATVNGLPVPGNQVAYDDSNTDATCTGNNCYKKLINNSNVKPFNNNYAQKMINHLRVPQNINEWYYIVANWNPDIIEQRRLQGCSSTGIECSPDAITSQKYFDNYWKWHVNYGYTGEEGILATEADFASNPNLREGDPDNDNPCENDTDGDGYCYNYIGAYTHNSGFGAKCKVEMISRTDLLRAKGFKE